MVTLLHDGRQAFPAMLSAIASARSEILMEMYWFASDLTGSQFADALSEKARQGVLVRVIYDAVGSFNSDSRQFAQMRDAGCEVEEYNTISPWRARFRLGVVNRRNHRKILVVDRRTAFTGGVNLGDPWEDTARGGGGWRDDMIRIEGPAAEQMRSIFQHTWTSVREVAPRTGSSIPPPIIELPDDTGSRVRVLANHYFGERRAIRRAYLERIRDATHSICISNSYFVPDNDISRALYDAVRRGVDVRVIVPGRSDVPAVHYAGRHLYSDLLQYGVQLQEWVGPMFHAKTAVVDRTWSTVGTYNMDYRSWRSNLEITAEIDDSEFGLAMFERFHEDLKSTRRIDPATWEQRATIERAFEQTCYLFRRVL